MPVAAIGAVAGVGSALLQNRAAGKAASAANRASEQANALQQQQYEQTRSDLNPYLQEGQNALAGINRLNAGDYSGFQNSPDYQFAMQQGLQGVDRSAAARGALYSGGQQADLTNYAQGMASQQLGQYRNSLMSLANMGASSGSALAGVGQNYAGAVGNNLANGANATGSAALTQGNNLSQLTAGLGGLANNYLQQRQSSFNPPANNLLQGQLSTGQGSAYNFGNNTDLFANSGRKW